MKTSIYKANGKTFATMYNVRQYATKLGLRIVKTDNIVSTKNNIIHLIELAS